MRAITKGESPAIYSCSKVCLSSEKEASLDRTKPANSRSREVGEVAEANEVEVVEDVEEVGEVREVGELEGCC
jgi:hypothetical protein